MYKNTVEPERPQVAIWRMCTAYWITKATNTHSEYVILLAFSIATMDVRTRSVFTTLSVLFDEDMGRLSGFGISICATNI
jgi:hypothetical protein